MKTNKWYPVENCPYPTGVTLLVFVQDLYEHKTTRIIRAFYAADRSIESTEDTEPAEYDEETDTYWLEEGWYEDTEFGDYAYTPISEGNVTHWMPLPEPPTT